MVRPSTSWDHDAPAGSEAKALGDNRIREFKQQFEDLFSADHELPGAGQGDNWGYHNRCTFLEQTDLGVGDVGVTLFGTETVNGKPELMFTDEDNSDIQLTKAGFLHLDQGRLSNNTFIVARNAGNTADLSLIKLNASNLAELPDAAVMTTDAAPTADRSIANKKYVDDEITAAIAGLDIPDDPVGFGAKVAKSFETTYQADTDGIVTGFTTLVTSTHGFDAYTDSSATPTAKVQSAYGPWVSGALGLSWPISFPVKKNDYYKVTTTNGGGGTLYFTPHGT